MVFLLFDVTNLSPFLLIHSLIHFININKFLLVEDVGQDGDGTRVWLEGSPQVLRSGHKLFVAYSPVVREEMVLGGVRRESL